MDGASFCYSACDLCNLGMVCFVMAVPSYQYSQGIFVRFITLYRKSRLIIARATMIVLVSKGTFSWRGESLKSQRF